VSVTNINLRGSDGETTNEGINLLVLTNHGKALLYYNKATKVDHVGAIERVTKLQGRVTVTV